MIRIPKLTDYAIVLLCQLAADSDRPVRNARELAVRAHMPVPTVSKLLKVLSRAGILSSHRGVRGGYSLARPASEVSVADIILAVEGPIALTECTSGVANRCSLERQCPARHSWQKVNAAIRGALEGLRLSDMVSAPPRKNPDSAEAGPGLAPAAKAIAQQGEAL